MTTIDARVAAVRRFNRFYTRRIGVLQDGLLESPFSLAEARVLYELAQCRGLTASELRGLLGLDAGYLSRMLRNFRKQGLVAGEASSDDARRTHLRLTAAGRRSFAPLDARSRSEVAAMLGVIPDAGQDRLVSAMRSIESLLGQQAVSQGQLVLRQHRPGDIGWVISAHGALYAAEFGWDESFEAMVADIAAGFVRRFDPDWERCWIAELDGARVGSVFLVRQSKTVAKLRMLILDPAARGLGIGRRLVAACVAHARDLGYRRLTLWTQRNLTAARKIYRAEGFRLVSSQRHHSFGVALTGEYWELPLQATAVRELRS